MEVRGGKVRCLRTTQGEVPCEVVVNAAGCWAGQVAEMVGERLPVLPVRGQIVLTEQLPPLFQHILISKRVYMVPKASGSIIVGSTREFVGHNKEVTMEGIRCLVEGAVEVVPALAHVAAVRTWAGLRSYTSDELPALGYMRGLEGFLLASGHFRNGFMLSPITGKLMSELLTKGDTSIPLGPFDPGRFQ